MVLFVVPIVFEPYCWRSKTVQLAFCGPTCFERRHFCLRTSCLGFLRQTVISKALSTTSASILCCIDQPTNWPTDQPTTRRENGSSAIARYRAFVGFDVGKVGDPAPPAHAYKKIGSERIDIPNLLARQPVCRNQAKSGVVRRCNLYLGGQPLGILSSSNGFIWKKNLLGDVILDWQWIKRQGA